MAEDQSRIGRWKQAREALSAAEREAELLGPDPELLARYAGQWVMIRNGQVIAAAPSGRELAKIADIRRYPNAVVVYVPTREEQSGVHILLTREYEAK